MVNRVGTTEFRVEILRKILKSPPTMSINDQQESEEVILCFVDLDANGYITAKFRPGVKGIPNGVYMVQVLDKGRQLIAEYEVQNNQKDTMADKTVENALKVIDEILAELSTVSAEPRVGREQMNRWKERSSRNIEESISNVEAKRFRKVYEPVYMGNPEGSLIARVENYSAFLHTLRKEIETHFSDILRESNSESEPAMKEQPDKNKVFIVHGHDEGNRFRLRDLLKDRFKLSPIILQDEASAGRTIIEKFEAEALKASFAFVLLTPDDTVKKGDSVYGQARPNVIFELGWFYGRLGRKNVCIIFKKGTSIHSDLDGIGRVEFINSVDEKLIEIERELKNAGVIQH